MFDPMFSAARCAKGAVAVFLLATIHFHNAWVGLGFALVPLFFLLVALMEG